MADLQDLLDLLADNTTGDISAADMRQIVSDLWDQDNGVQSVAGTLFDTSAPNPGHVPGLLHWNGITGTLEMDSPVTDVSLQIGYEQWTDVRNNSGATIANGRAVRIMGATGQRPNVALDTGQGLIFGVATHDIPNNSNGVVATFGLVRDLNTSAFTDGVRVYATSTGTLTTSTTASFVGFVLLAHVSQGIILARPGNLNQATGTTAQRPTTVGIGFTYFDTTLNRPIWWNGTTWRFSDGTAA